MADLLSQEFLLILESSPQSMLIAHRTVDCDVECHIITVITESDENVRPKFVTRESLFRLNLVAQTGCLAQLGDDILDQIMPVNNAAMCFATKSMIHSEITFLVAITMVALHRERDA